MQHEEQVRVLKGLMDHLDRGTNVDVGYQVKNPTASYTSPEIAAQEWESFFQDYPHLLGLSGELPEPGSFFTSTDLGKPILCTRDMDGKFHAFLNVCRHRGVVVETAERGRKKLFSCPFHAWTYSTTGDLVAVPKEDHFGAVDKSCHSLVALPAVERHGLLWVSPNPEHSFDIDDLLGDLGDELGHWNMESCARHDATTYKHACNWKLANDTFGETYHFETLHRDTLSPSFYGNVQMYDTYKRNHRMALCLRSIDTMRGTPTDSWHILRGTAPVYYLFPNIQLVMTGGGPILVRIYPDAGDPSNSRSEITWYTFPEEVRRSFGIPEEQDEGRLSITGRMEGFAAIIEAEDYVVAASSQVGALSGAQDFVTFGRNEPALHHYHSTFRKALGQEPLETLESPISSAAE